MDFKWQSQYGDVVRIQAALGVSKILLVTCPFVDCNLVQEDRLLVSDPKALQYIYQTSRYRFIKPPGVKEFSRLGAGTGIFCVKGLQSKFTGIAC